MQNVLISIEDNAVDKVMYLLKNLSDVKIVNEDKTNSLDDELNKRVNHYKNNSADAIEFGTNLDKIREQVASKL